MLSDKISDKNKSLPTKADGLRSEAEDWLREKPPVLPSSRTKEDMLRLVHELEVHQIELEMQNAELRRTQEELQQSRDKYAELYDLAPVGYLTLDAGGVVREMNLTCARQLGIERSLPVNKNFNEFIADENGRDIFADHLKSVFHGQGTQRCEVRIRGKKGPEFHGLLQSVKAKAFHNRNRCILTSIIDDTVRKLLEEELQKANEQLELTVMERTGELTRMNVQLTQEVVKHQEAVKSVRSAFVEIKALKDRLLAENLYLHQDVAHGHNFGDIIGKSKALAHVFLRVEQVAPMNATVLLLGETGSGKGVIARAIHSRSARKDRPLVTVNCTSLPANLIESELFGRERGAFTGSNSRQIGRFELADRGTILLDEIGELPLELQCKLLRVIQDGEFERLGSPRTLKTDVRIIAATNRNLEEEVSKGRFREDLFYRLNVFPIPIPPLRLRKEDIPLLVLHFIAKFNKKIGKRIEAVSNDTLRALQKYHWPGNVRELESVVERAVIASQGTMLQVSDCFDAFHNNVEQTEKLDVKALCDLEKDHILLVLRKTGWRIEGEKGAALILGLNPSTLRARMRKFGIQRQQMGYA